MATGAENLSTASAPLQGIPTKPIDAIVPVSAKPDRVEDSVITTPSTGHSDSNERNQDLEDSKSSKVSAVCSRSIAVVSDTEKKIRRAERFGITVQLSEQEKRNSRAERFGTESGSRSGFTLNNSEELKRKARAERFGLLVTADEEAKKKARLQRFAPTSKMDILEEDKKKARELRFSQPLSKSLSMNGEGNIEPKAAVAGKAGGGS